MNKSDFSEAIQALRRQETVPVLNLLRTPELGSILSKTIQDTHNPPIKDREGNRKTYTPDVNLARQLSQNKMQDITDAESVMQLLPDLELAAQILISAILSPKDMMSVELVYQPNDDLVPPSVSSTLSGIIREYISEDYKMESRLTKILRDILFDKGAYPIAVIPENAIDEIINGSGRISTEALDEVMDTQKGVLNGTGLLGPAQANATRAWSMESYQRQTTQIDPVIKLTGNLIANEALGKSLEGDDTGLFTVTDNFAALSMPALEARLQAQAIREVIPSPANEAYGELTDSVLEDIIYRRTNYELQEVTKIKTQDQCYRQSVGEPLIMHLPPESVLPVIIPGSPSEGLGYFILTDETGHPVTRNAELDHYRELGSMTFNNKKSLASSLIERASQMYFGSGSNQERERMNFAARMYGEIIETDLLNRLRNGIYGQSVKIGGYTELYRVMLSRALQQKRTQFIFIPADLMSYMAFRYDQNGIGYSLLDNMKVVNSLAVHVLLADTRAAVMNSIPRTKVEVQLDEDEPNTLKRREEIVNEYLLLRSAGNNGMPMGTSNPAEITTWANSAGVEFHFSGAKDMPDMSIDISEHNSNIVRPDSDLLENLKTLRINGVGLTPETIDATMGANFATSILQESLMLSRRAMQHQDDFMPHITRHMRIMILNSPKTMKALTEVILDNFEDVIKLLMPEVKEITMSAEQQERVAKRLVVAYVNKFELSLPKPDGVSVKAKQEAYDTYKSSLEEVLNNVLSQDVFNGQLLGETMPGVIDEIKATMMAHYLRKWQVDNDFMTETLELITSDDEDEPLLDVYQIQVDHAESLARSIGKMLDKAKHLKTSADAYAQANELESSGGGGSWDSSSDSDDTDGGGDDFDFGGDSDFDFGSDDGPADGESEGEPEAESGDNPDENESSF